MNPSRFDLTRKWISKRYKVLADQGSLVMKGLECRLRIERLSSSNSNSTNIKIGSNNQLNNVSSLSAGKRITSLLLGAGKRGSIRYNDQLIGIKCLRGGVDNYQVELIVDETRGGVSTAISIRKGQRINIGEIVDGSKSRNRQLGLSKGLGLSKSRISSKFTYFLMID